MHKEHGIAISMPSPYWHINRVNDAITDEMMMMISNTPIKR